MISEHRGSEVDYASATAWPWEEARKIVAKLQEEGERPRSLAAVPGLRSDPEKADRDPRPMVTFQTGYGPSGLPHIGTFGEVTRTVMVRHAFEVLTAGRYQTRLLCFSDDLDGLRRVPDNVPQQELLQAALHYPLTQVPDPFGTHDSFGRHNNARLCSFLDAFGFDYHLVSSTDFYQSGAFDPTLLSVLKNYDAIMSLVLPTLGSDRQATYSPFLPLCPRTKRVLQVPMVDRNLQDGTITYVDPDTQERMTTPVVGGAVKLQWKVDWAARWVALGVDYEMAGKDLIDSVRLSSKIARVLGGTPPASLSYELFLDGNGEKISKSKGNGLSIESWLRYGTLESLSLFMFQKPRTAKRMHLGLVPKTVDELYSHQASYESLSQAEQWNSPMWHVRATQNAPSHPIPAVSYALLLNLVSAAPSADEAQLWSFVQRYRPGATPDNDPELAQLVSRAVQYHRDFIAPTLCPRSPNAKERAALTALAERLTAVVADPQSIGLRADELDTASANEPVQNVVYEVGKAHDFQPLRAWFQGLYEVLLGQSSGPRFGSFVSVFGIQATCDLIAARLAESTSDGAE